MLLILYIIYIYNINIYIKYHTISNNHHHPYIDSTTVLSDIYIYTLLYYGDCATTGT